MQSRKGCCGEDAHNKSRQAKHKSHQAPRCTAQAQTGSRPGEHRARPSTCQEVQPPKLSTVGAHALATRQGKEGTICRSHDTGRDSPAPRPRSTMRAHIEVMAPLPAREEGKSLPAMASGRVEEVINVSHGDCHDFIPSSFLFQFPLLEFAKPSLTHPTSHPALHRGPRGITLEEQLSAPVRPIPAKSPSQQSAIWSQ